MRHREHEECEARETRGQVENEASEAQEHVEHENIWDTRARKTPDTWSTRARKARGTQGTRARRARNLADSLCTMSVYITEAVPQKCFYKKVFWKICSKFTGEHLCQTVISILKSHFDMGGLYIFAAYFQNTLSWEKQLGAACDICFRLHRLVK